MFVGGGLPRGLCGDGNQGAVKSVGVRSDFGGGRRRWAHFADHTHEQTSASSPLAILIGIALLAAETSAFHVDVDGAASNFKTFVTRCAELPAKTMCSHMHCSNHRNQLLDVALQDCSGLGLPRPIFRRSSLGISRFRFVGRFGKPVLAPYRSDQVDRFFVRAGPSPIPPTAERVHTAAPHPHPPPPQAHARWFLLGRRGPWRSGVGISGKNIPS